MIIDELFEAPQQCPECGGISFSDLILAEKKDACYYKVKASAKVWPSAYASGRLVQCRKKGAANYGKSKNEGVAEDQLDEISQDTARSYVQKVIQSKKDLTNQTYRKGADLDKLNKKIKNRQQGMNRAHTDKRYYKDEPGVAEQQELDEKWSQKYKKSINCANPKGFSQRAHCAGRKKNEDVAEAGPLDQRRNLPPLTGVELGGSQVPQFRLPIIPDNMPGGARMPGGAGLSRNIATQRSVGGKAIPSVSKPGNFVPGTISDPVLTKLGGKDVRTTSGPTVKVQPRGSEYEPLAVDVPAYVRQGKPDPVTLPVGKPKITVRPGETVPQAIQRTKAEQEFGQFLKGQSGQTFGAGAGRGTVNPPAAKSNAPKELTIDPNDPKTFTKQATSSNPEMDKIMKKWDQEQRSTPASLSSPSKSKTSPSKFLQLFGPDKMDEASRKKREQPEVEYDDEYDAMVARVKKLAGLGPMKTVYDPAKRVYRNIPTAVQPPKK